MSSGRQSSTGKQKKLSALWMGGVFAVAVLALGIFNGGTASAATDEPDGSGVYRYLEIALRNDFRVYARPGETIHVSVFPGVGVDTNFPNADLCNLVQILQSNGSPVTGNGRISGVRSDGTTFGVAQGGATINRNPAETSTCSTGGSTDNRPFRQVTLSYTVPAGYTITSMEGAFIVRFANSTTPGDRVQGYEWRIAVSNDANYINSSSIPTSAAKPGRAWFVGDDQGLRVWQRNVQATLTSNGTNHVFKYVRKDGYRYAVKYTNYQGIWSTFHAGVYGVTKTSDGRPGYMSYDEDYGSYTYTLTADPAGNYNLAYVFVDCLWNSDCPNDIPFLRSQPITSDDSVTDTTAARNTYTKDTLSNTNSPIADATPDSNATKNFRYTGYTASNLAGGTVTIPYSAMQTGYIRLEAWRGATGTGELLCRRDFLVDDADGNGIAGPNKNGVNASTWRLQVDANCLAGTLRTTGVTIAATERLNITAQARHLGEMHFIDVDTEQRGSIEIVGNGRGTDEQRRSVIWYDPFSRATADYCGTIPPRVASGSLSHSSTGWDSMSSGITFGGVTLPRIASNTSGGASSERRAFDSLGGVHGWLSSESICDGTGTGSDDGYSNNDGTASNESTWGNDRVIEDWTYAFSDPVARVLSIGGITYQLTPSVTPTSSTVSPGQSVTFTSNVTNSSSSTSNQTNWVIRRILIPVGASLNTAARPATTASGFSCAYYTSVGGGVTCADVHTGDRTFASGSVQIGSDLESGAITTGLPVGTRICYAAMVNSFNGDPAPNYREVVSCVMIAASPYVTIVGGNIWAGGSIISPYSGSAWIRGASPATYGSTGEYGVFATGAIGYFGSAGRLGGASTVKGAVDGARLTFASENVASLPTLGNFSASHRITNWTSLCPGGLINTVNLGAGVPLVLGAGTHQIVCANVVNIRGNITYNTAGAITFGQLPSLTVIANTIQIDGSVAEIAGNFYAANAFVTCSEGPRVASSSAAITTTGTCSARRLTVNGAVTIANQAVNSLVLNRSIGGSAPSQTAEIIRMRPEVFLTPFENGSTLLTTVQETELPARY